MTIIAALALAACGDDSDDGAAETTEASETTDAGDPSETAETTETAPEADGDDDGGESSPAGALSKEEYEERFREIGEQSQERSAEIQESVSEVAPDDLEAISGAFGELGTHIGEVTAELDALEPPPDIAAEHQGYVDVLAGTGGAYGEIADAVAEADNPETARAALGRLQEVFAEPGVRKAVRAFARAVKRGGYDIGLELDPAGAVPGGGSP